MEVEDGRKRRRYSRELKAQILAECEAPGASVDAAVAASAHDVLVALAPDQASLVEAEYSRALATIEEGPAKLSGIVTGRASAA